MVQVYDSFDSTISIAESVEKTENYNNVNSVVIDNTGNKTVYPVFEITTTINGLALDSITNGDQSIVFDSIMNLASGDNLVLDFENQIYELNGISVINDITISSLISIIQNIENIIQFTYTGDINIKLTYETYDNEVELHYLETFKPTIDANYRTSSVFDSVEKGVSKLNGYSYNFNIRKMTVDSFFYDKITQSKDLRIKYKKYNPATYEEDVKYLIGAYLEKWDEGFSSMGEFIFSNVSGKAKTII